ncbi:hypothetical protein L861_17720 [Litchfieldella anticariensis FP35 = DSM 16096]|uniref:Signal transduction protein n=1 Tax=Litchfieldella anticariensis (strain DSM 16096 / CECT 5854 / CIP 108499 / LMG 22089 / FP35) TaxID=1121939 RepID=S2LFB3_LITA3|nr:DUF294 nucleotidyltransferase-like domain-containing protein [Halomonas anticariensis]EPC03381.1 hypothetical protein L861_17720 [Halomonas anticariensis FP35 = DSM 16096]
MRLLHRASPWRELFTHDSLPDWRQWPPLLAPLADAFERLGPTPSLAKAKTWQFTLVDALQRLDLPAWRISQLLSDHNDWIYRHAIIDSLNDLKGSGWGEPPVGFCVLILGSGARHESLLGPDQDNAMIIDEYPDARHREIDGYFQALGERFTARLDTAGIPFCNGHVMASWPMWRKRLSEWCEQLQLWTADRRVKRVQQSNILFDFASVYGDVRLADALRDEVVRLMPRAGLFLDEMAVLLDEVPVALDRRGRLNGDDEGAPHERAINLKRQGLMPLISAVRLLSLAHGGRSVDTQSRLAELVSHGVMDVSRARALNAALERLQAIVLESQLNSLAAGRLADGWVDMAVLDKDKHLLLRHDLQQIQSLISLAKSASSRR